MFVSVAPIEYDPRKCLLGAKKEDTAIMTDKQRWKRRAILAGQCSKACGNGITDSSYQYRLYQSNYVTAIFIRGYLA